MQTYSANTEKCLKSGKLSKVAAITSSAMHRDIYSWTLIWDPDKYLKESCLVYEELKHISCPDVSIGLEDLGLFAGYENTKIQKN